MAKGTRRRPPGIPMTEDDMNVNIGITDDNRQRVVAILNTLLADEYLLYTKTRNFHWNVTGPQFNDLHKFFEAQYEALDDVIDEVAERVRALGGRAAGTLEEFRRGAPGTRHAGRSARRPRGADPHAARGHRRRHRSPPRRRHRRLPHRAARA